MIHEAGLFYCGYSWPDSKFPTPKHNMVYLCWRCWSFVGYGTELGQPGQVPRVCCILFSSMETSLFLIQSQTLFFLLKESHANEQSSSQNHELEAWGQEKPNMWLECIDVSLFYLRIGMASSMLATSAALAVTRMGSLRIHRTLCNVAM